MKFHLRYLFLLSCITFYAGFVSSVVAAEQVSSKKSTKRMVKKQKVTPLPSEVKSVTTEITTENTTAPAAPSVATVQDQISTQASSVESAPIAQKTTAPASSKLVDKLSSSYTMWVTGSKIKAMDGVEGKGENLTLNQFLMFGYKFDEKNRIYATQYYTHSVRNSSKGERNLTFYDPYLTLSNSSLWENKNLGLNLAGYIRYYMPFSHESADNVGQANDQKYGKFRVKVEPSKTFLDGALSLTLSTFIFRSLPGAKPSEGVEGQRDWYVWFYPKVGYQVSEKFQPYFAYSNVLTHNRLVTTRQGGGRWSKLNGEHNLELGFEWQPFSKLNINPYMEYGGAKFTLPESNVGLVAELTFM